MLDNELKKLLADQLDLAVHNAGWDFDVVQKQQPHQQGIPEKGTVFFEHLFDIPYGFAKTILVYDESICKFKETEVQWTRSTFQISTMQQEDPEFPCAPTASDIANQMRMHVNSRNVARSFIRCGIGMERVTEVRNPYFDDDKERFEAHPSFDIVLMHTKSITMDVPAIVKVEAEVYVVD